MGPEQSPSLETTRRRDASRGAYGSQGVWRAATARPRPTRARYARRPSTTTTARKATSLRTTAQSVWSLEGLPGRPTSARCSETRVVTSCGIICRRRARSTTSHRPTAPRSLVTRSHWRDARPRRRTSLRCAAGERGVHLPPPQISRTSSIKRPAATGTASHGRTSGQRLAASTESSTSSDERRPSLLTAATSGHGGRLSRN